jgi:hypothetical protein
MQQRAGAEAKIFAGSEKSKRLGPPRSDAPSRATGSKGHRRFLRYRKKITHENTTHSGVVFKIDRASC